MSESKKKNSDTAPRPDQTCAKCGACTSFCPVYQATGRESLTARGRLHILSKSTSNKPSHLQSEIFSKCLLCGACLASCPRGIDIPSQIISIRSEQPEVTGFSSFKKYLARQSLARSSFCSALSSLARSLHFIPDTIPKESGLRLKLPFAPETLPSSKKIQSARHHNETESKKKEEKALRAFKETEISHQALYFKGCLASYLVPEIGQASTILAARLCHYSLESPTKQHCCGMAALSAGDQNQAKELAKQNILAFSGDKLDNLPIFTSCASCFSQLRSYPKLFDKDSEWRTKAQAFAKRVEEFSTFFCTKSKNMTDQLATSQQQDNVVYHDPCHLRYFQNDVFPPSTLTRNPRKLIAQFPNIHLQELPHGPQCCGQGGLFHIAHPDLSKTITEKITDDFKKTQATQVVSTCSGCLLQWKMGFHKAGLNKSASHLALLLLKQLS